MCKSLLILFCAVATLAQAAEADKPKGTVIAFSVDASQTVGNDLARATAFTEATDASSAEVARKVKAAVAQAIATAKSYEAVKTKSGSTWTSPVYGKNGRRIEAWHMRSELHLESRDVAALGELVGKLQEGLGVSQITLQPAPETRRKAEEDATVDALNAFRDKAQRIAGNFRKYYRILRMDVGSGGSGPVYPMARAAMMKAEDAAMPIESGESTITATVSGEIELVD